MSNLDEESETSTQFKHETNLAAFQEELKAVPLPKNQDYQILMSHLKLQKVN